MTRVSSCDWRGLPAWQLLAADGAEAILLERGAQVVSWRTSDGQERLFVSPAARLETGQPIRGGVPICFPQFAARGPLPQHGLVRTGEWRCLQSSAEAGRLIAVLEDDTSTRSQWPHAFRLQMEVALATDALSLSLQVCNRGDTPFRFMVALHTYFATADVTRCRLEGLPAGRVHDNTQSADVDFTGGSLSLEAPVDQVHAGIEAPLILRDSGPSGESCLVMTQSGFTDAVVWNPGAQRAQQIADLPPGEWRKFICVESARINQPVELAAGAAWTGTQLLSWRNAGR